MIEFFKRSDIKKGITCGGCDRLKLCYDDDDDQSCGYVENRLVEEVHNHQIRNTQGFIWPAVDCIDINLEEDGVEYPDMDWSTASYWWIRPGKEPIGFQDIYDVWVEAFI